MTARPGSMVAQRWQRSSAVSPGTAGASAASQSTSRKSSTIKNTRPIGGPHTSRATMHYALLLQIHHIVMLWVSFHAASSHAVLPSPAHSETSDQVWSPRASWCLAGVLAHSLKAVPLSSPLSFFWPLCLSTRPLTLVTKPANPSRCPGVSLVSLLRVSLSSFFLPSPCLSGLCVRDAFRGQTSLLLLTGLLAV